MTSPSDRLTALDELLPAGRDGVLVTALVTADDHATLSVGRRAGDPGEYLDVDVDVEEDAFLLGGRKVAPGACAHQAALFVCAALGVSEEYRSYRELSATGAEVVR